MPSLFISPCERTMHNCTKFCSPLFQELYVEPYSSIKWPQQRSNVSATDIYTPHTWLLDILFGTFMISFSTGGRDSVCGCGCEGGGVGNIELAPTLHVRKRTLPPPPPPFKSGGTILSTPPLSVTAVVFLDLKAMDNRGVEVWHVRA